LVFAFYFYINNILWTQQDLQRKTQDQSTFGQRLSDPQPPAMGSRRFIIFNHYLSCMMIANVGFVNTRMFTHLALYTYARHHYDGADEQSGRNRHHVELDYKTTLEAKKEIGQLMESKHY
jgi:uncharacterized membrane protein